MHDSLDFLNTKGIREMHQRYDEEEECILLRHMISFF